jgi:hypothetical protein
MSDDTKTLIDAIRNLLDDSNCEIDFERRIILEQTIADIEKNTDL